MPSVRAIAIVVLGLVSGCVHPVTVTRRVDGVVVRGPYVPPSTWQRAIELAIDERRTPDEARALGDALAGNDLPRAHALALRSLGTSDARVAELVEVAIVRAEDDVALEIFVEARAHDAAFAAHFAELGPALPDPLEAAVDRGLASSPLHGSRGALALARVGRMEQARVAARGAIATTLDDRLALTETALLVGEPERALALARDAYEAGASSRARVLEARALRALGRDVEARTIAAELAPGTSAAADADGSATAEPAVPAASLRAP